jgi:hypothetical protein
VTTLTLADEAARLALLGYAVFPCREDKAPACPRGFHDATKDPAVVRRLFALPGAALIGVATGAASGFDVLDLDPRNGSNAWDGADRLPPTTVHSTRSGGTHWLFRHRPGQRCSAGRIAPGVDVKADGGYVIWWPSAGCELVLCEPLEEWPEWISVPVRSSSSMIMGQRDAPPSAAVAAALLDRMPNPDDLSRDDYARVMLAAAGCYHAVDDDAECIAEAAVRWAARWSGSPGEDVEQEKWDSDWSRRTGGLAGWPQLLRHAARLGIDVSEFQATEFEADDVPAPRLAGQRMRNRFVFPSDCATGPRRGYLIKHLLAPGNVGALIGPPGTGKSMLAPYLAYAVAQGREAFGLRTKQGRTLYVAAEDVTGLRQRVHALMLQHGDAPGFALVDCPNLLDADAAADLKAAVADWKPALVVLDTLGAAFAGMDENSAQDMGKAVELSRSLAAQGCAVLLIHHTAKNGDGTPRGHSVLNGTLDMSLRLEPKDAAGVIRGVLGKNRNGTTDRPLAFRYVAVTLGTDEDGDAITAPRAVEISADMVQQPRRLKLSPAAKNVLRVLREMVAAGGPVREDAWRDRCENERAASTAEDPDSRKRSFRRAYEALRDAGLVEARNGCVALVADCAKFEGGPEDTEQNQQADKGGQGADKAGLSEEGKAKGGGRTRTGVLDPVRLSGPRSGQMVESAADEFP